MPLMPRARRVVLHGCSYNQMQLAFGCHALGAWRLTFPTVITWANYASAFRRLYVKVMRAAISASEQAVSVKLHAASAWHLQISGDG